MIKVSVIVPIYNSEIFLKRCLDSIVNQTLKDIEIILINDGSKDNSRNICEEYANRDNRIKFINKKNEGTSIARNVGLDIATGEYITFVDSDDYIELNAFEKMYNIAQETTADIVLFNHYHGENNLNNVKFPKNKLLRGKELKEILKTANTDFFIPFSWRNIFKNTDKQKTIKFKTNLKYGEDSLYNLESYLGADSMYCSEKAFYHQMPNINSTMSSQKEDFLLYLENLYDEKMKLYNEKGLVDFKQDLYNYTIQHTLNILIEDILRFTSIKKLRKPFKKIRNSNMIIESYKRCNIKLSNLNVSILHKRIMFLLKYRCYDLISLYIILRYILKR